VTGATAIRLAGLRVDAPTTSGGKSILGPLDLELPRGERVLLVGPSGCGKTTLLRAIAGLVTPAAGTVDLDGVRASEVGRLVVPPHRRGVGMLFQGGALWPHMTARKTLEFVIASAGGKPSDARIAELLALVRLSGFEDRRPDSLSGGESQRLALARAMASEPKILLLDEPLGPLDRPLRAELLEMLSELHGRFGWTTLHVTHDPEEARGYADRVLTLTSGGMLAENQA